MLVLDFTQNCVQNYEDYLNYANFAGIFWGISPKWFTISRKSNSKWRQKHITTCTNQKYLLSLQPNSKTILLTHSKSILSWDCWTITPEWE